MFCIDYLVRKLLSPVSTSIKRAVLSLISGKISLLQFRTEYNAENIIKFRRTTRTHTEIPVFYSHDINYISPKRELTVVVLYEQPISSFINNNIGNTFFVCRDRFINRYAGSASELQYNGEGTETFVRRYEGCQGKVGKDSQDLCSIAKIHAVENQDNFVLSQK